MKIDIITCHRAFNYGAVLQTYALQKYLKNLGYDVEVIDYTPKYMKKSQNKNIIKRIIRPIVRYYDFKCSNKVFGKFLKENISLTPRRYFSYEELKSDIPLADVYIAGSDQIWNCNIGNGKDDAFFLNFVPKGKRKISYAASIAMDIISDEDKERFKRNLEDFNAISVREETAKKILGEINIKNVEKVVDPVYLLKQSEWDELAQKSDLDLDKEKYILVYGFKRQENLYKYARNLANKRNYKIYSINTNFEDKFLDVDKYFYNASPTDFIKLVKNSQEIVTNSFHGLSFSIIYNKPVHQFKKSGNANSRMVDLLKELNMIDRLIENEAILDNKVECEKRKSIIEINRNRSIKFLKESLEE